MSLSILSTYAFSASWLPNSRIVPLVDFSCLLLRIFPFPRCVQPRRGNIWERSLYAFVSTHTDVKGKSFMPRQNDNCVRQWWRQWRQLVLRHRTPSSRRRRRNTRWNASFLLFFLLMTFFPFVLHRVYLFSFSSSRSVINNIIRKKIMTENVGALTYHAEKTEAYQSKRREKETQGEQEEKRD